MTIYNFQLTIAIDDVLEQRDFKVPSRTFSLAVRDSLAQMMRGKPLARLKRLTFFHPPLVPR